jgi:hypothetical protein
MTPGLPGAGIGGIFYLVAALLAPLCEAVRTIRGQGSRRRWRSVLNPFLLAVSILALLWLTAWTAGVIFTSRVVTQHLGVTADGLQTEVISRRIALSTITVLALVLASVEVLSLVVCRPSGGADQPAGGDAPLSSVRSPRPRINPKEQLVLPTIASEKPL